ncbi:MAG TPA: FAD-dependent monooxygenase [Caulobacteraceae bacterium]|nr:FAD-dependent monooxygenase [Caulobacteraceae bacterium]
MSDMVIVGGGLAGGAAAALLARAGSRPLLLERESGPRDKICGEFLSTEAQAHLTALGLDLARLGGARVGSVRLVASERCAEARLPFTALGLTRRRLDEALLTHAQALGASVERGVTVRAVSPGVVESSRGSLEARTILLASGKHDVRGARRDTAGAIKGMVGFKSYFRLSPSMRAALGGFVEVVLFEGGYAGLQLVEGGVANLCLLVDHDRFDAAGRTWPGLLAELLREPHLTRRLADAEELSARPLTIADVPYGFIHRHDDDPGLFRLGDQAAVIPSFSGDGMSIALHSATLAARAIGEGADAGRYHATLRADIARPVRLATWLQRRIASWPGRRAIVFALGLAPGGLDRLASWTRVPASALRRAGLDPAGSDEPAAC